MNGLKINVLSESNWREYKSIRLESLQDSPDSFASTYEREAAFTTEQWRSRLRVSASIHDALAIAAVSNQKYIGLLSSVIHSPNTNEAHLYQMWVSPEYRGEGVGTQLVDRVRLWAVDRSIRKLLLTVTTTNIEAISLYQTIGFMPVGVVEQLRSDSDLQSQVMQMELCAADS